MGVLLLCLQAHDAKPFPHTRKKINGFRLFLRDLQNKVKTLVSPAALQKAHSYFPPARCEDKRKRKAASELLPAASFDRSRMYDLFGSTDN